MHSALMNKNFERYLGRLGCGRRRLLLRAGRSDASGSEETLQALLLATDLFFRFRAPARLALLRNVHLRLLGVLLGVKGQEEGRLARLRESIPVCTWCRQRRWQQRAAEESMRAGQAGRSARRRVCAIFPEPGERPLGALFRPPVPDEAPN
jgi:hypothetical protein